MQHLDHLSLHLFILVCDEGTIARAFLATNAGGRRIGASLLRVAFRQWSEGRCVYSG